MKATNNVFNIKKQITDKKSNYRKTTPLQRNWNNFRLPSKLKKNKKQRRLPLTSRSNKQSIRARTTHNSLEREEFDTNTTMAASQFLTKDDTSMDKNRSSGTGYPSTLADFKETLKNKIFQKTRLTKNHSLESSSKSLKKFTDRLKDNMLVKKDSKRSLRRGSLKMQNHLKIKIQNIGQRDHSHSEKKSSRTTQPHPRTIALLNAITPKNNLGNKGRFFTSNKKSKKVSPLLGSAKSKFNALDISSYSGRVSKFRKSRNQSFKLIKELKKNSDDLSNDNKNSFTERSKDNSFYRNSPQKLPFKGKFLKPETSSLESSCRRKSKRSISKRSKVSKIWSHEMEKIFDDYKNNDMIEDIGYTFELFERIFDENKDLKQKLDDNYRATQNLMDAFTGFQKSLKDRCRQKQSDCEERATIIQNLEGQITKLQKTHFSLQENNKMLKVENESLLETIRSFEKDNQNIVSRDNREFELEEMLKNQQDDFDEEKDFMQMEMVSTFPVNTPLL